MKNKICVVTGASSGLGKATAELLAEIKKHRVLAKVLLILLQLH
jgi:NAD(P)-dependent dehydrogenase (short-subunit alcohol dehydrogenase family)